MMPRLQGDGHTIWLFAGSDDGGERAANIYSLLGAARLTDLNPEALCARANCGASDQSDRRAASAEPIDM